MPDAFASLRAPDVPVSPLPAFAARLRGQVEAALGRPVPAPAGEALQEGDLAYLGLQVPDLDMALAFYRSVLGWEFEHGHVAAGSTPSMGLRGGAEAAAVLPCFVVGDIHAGAARVREAGGTATEPRRDPWGWVADCVDDQGMPLALFQPPEGAPGRRPEAQRQGDVSYMTYELKDSARTRAFLSRVVGATFSPGRLPDSWQAQGLLPMTGMRGGHAVTSVLPMFQVDDIQAAVGRLRALGGIATDPVAMPYGWQALCRDNQGLRFYLGQH